MRRTRTRQREKRFVLFIELDRSVCRRQKKSRQRIRHLSPLNLIIDLRPFIPVAEKKEKNLFELMKNIVWDLILPFV